MSKYIGRRLNVGIGRETTRGTFIAPTFYLPRTGFSFFPKTVKPREEEALGRLEDSDSAFITTRYGEGSVDGEIRDKSFGLFLYSMLGTVSTAGPTDSAYAHTFTLANSNQHQSLSFLVDDPNTKEGFRLVMLNELTITSELDEIVKYSASFMSKDGATSTATQATLAAENKFTKKHLGVKVAAALANLDAASVLSVKSLSITISKNTVLDDVLGTAEPEDILNRQISIEGEITLNYEDETWKNYMKNGTNRAMEIKFTNTDTLIGATSRPTLQFRLPKVDFFDWEPDYGLNEIVSQKISFKGSYDVSGGNSVLISILTNAQTSY